jgi:hypothetical protein
MSKSLVPADGDTDARLVLLGETLDAAFAVERALVGRPVADEAKAEAEIFAEYDRTNAIVQSAIEIPAKTLEGLRVKARALSFINCENGIEGIFSDEPSLAECVARSIIRDLLAA